MPELGPEIPRVEELIGEKEEAEASEGAQKSHYGRNIAIATIVTTLIGALVAFAQAGAVQNHDRADARAETYGTLAGSASAIATGRADIQEQFETISRPIRFGGIDGSVDHARGDVERLIVMGDFEDRRVGLPGVRRTGKLVEMFVHGNPSREQIAPVREVTINSDRMIERIEGNQALARNGAGTRHRRERHSAKRDEEKNSGQHHQGLIWGLST